jgi:hypothetical protein
MKEESTFKAATRLVLAALTCFALCYFCGKIHAQTPSLIVTAGSTGQASTLTITSDSQLPWKCFTVSGGSGSYGVIWAESNGTSGGIYFGTITTAASGNAGPVTPPAPVNDLPIAALTTSVSAAVANVDDATASAAAILYETIAKEVDAGAITTPTQLYLSTGVQVLALTAEQRTAVQPLTTAVAAWFNAQQTAGKLTEEKMADYSRVFHAVAAAIRPNKTAPAASKSGNSTPAAKVDCANTAPAGYEGKQLPGQSACANGQCPMPKWGRRR